ncbi:MAG: hypothetical protein WC700_14255 [Gemmatimonadaceae bacterium]
MATFIAETARDCDARIVHAGDIFNTVRPQPWAYDVADLLGATRDDAVGIIGNHGADGLSVRPEDVVHAVKFYRKPQVLRGADMDIALVPWLGRAWVAATYPDLLVGEQMRYMADALGRVVANLAAEKRAGIPLACVSHFVCQGEAWNSGTQPQVGESGDFIVPRSVFDRPEFAVVLLGHVHQPQEIAADHTRILSVGANVRSDFGEEGQPTRVLHVTPAGDGVDIAEIATPSVEFVSLEVVPPDERYPDGGLRDNTRGFLEHIPVAGKVVRLTGELPAGEEAATLISRMTAVCLQAGALKVTKPAVRFHRTEARAVRAIALDAKPDTALRSYAELVGGDVAERLDDLLAVQRELAEVGADA